MTGARADVRAETPGTARLVFPEGFVWGAATSAYQIEGATTEDGRGTSIWDTFGRVPGNILAGETGDVAADHYHRYREDVALMSELGIGTYRFSISWPRVIPTGSGTPNARGIDFYSRLVDALLEQGIRPLITLYHWDLPQELENAGGWTNRDTAAWFADYAGVVAGALGDRADMWATLNEPWCSAFLGYGAGVHAPGRADPAVSLSAAHHLLLGHGLAVTALRSQLPATARISIPLNLAPIRTAGDSQPDRDAVRRVDGLRNRLFLDPLFRGSYPTDVVDDTSSLTDWSFVQASDLATIAAPIDLLGVNYYAPILVAAWDGRSPRQQEVGHASTLGTAWPGCEDVDFPIPPGPLTAMGWEIDGDGLYDLLVRVHSDYPQPPILVMENGAAFDDSVDDSGAIDDVERVRYLHEHLVALHRAIAAGVPVEGYLVWSLLDNFEWAYGYSKRFGIAFVDFATQRRVPKRSAAWYRDVLAANGVPASL